MSGGYGNDYGNRYGDAVTFDVVDAAHGHVADAGRLTQTHKFVPVDTAHGHIADIAGSYELVPDDAAQAHTAEASALVSFLLTDDASHGAAADTSGITGITFNPADASHAHAAGEASGFVNLKPVSVFHDQTVDGTTVSIILEPADANHPHTTGFVTIYEFAPDRIHHGHTADVGVVRNNLVEFFPHDADHETRADSSRLPRIVDPSGPVAPTSPITGRSTVTMRVTVPGQIALRPHDSGRVVAVVRAAGEVMMYVRAR